MGAKNKVIAGDHNGANVTSIFGITMVQPSFDSKTHFGLNKTTVEAYEIITDEQRKSAASGIARGAVGAVLLGPIGLLAGLSAKNKGTYTVAIKLKNGQNSLLEVDEKIYKSIVKNCF